MCFWPKSWLIIFTFNNIISSLSGSLIRSPLQHHPNPHGFQWQIKRKLSYNTYIKQIGSSVDSYILSSTVVGAGPCEILWSNTFKVFRKYRLKMWGSNAYILAPLLTFSFGGDLEEEKYGVKYASNCEVCKVWIFLDQVSMSILKWKVQSTFQMCLQWKSVIKGCGCGVWEQTVGKPEVTWCDRDGLQSH